MRTGLCIALAAINAVAVAAQHPADRSRVVPVYWVPADDSIPLTHVGLVIRALDDVRAWYGRVLGGPTFRSEPLTLQRSRHAFAELADSSFQQWWPLGMQEFADYGLDWTDDDTKLLLITRAAGAWAGSESENGGIDSLAEAGLVPDGNLGGLAVIGDSSIAGYLAGVCPDSGRDGGTAWWCSWATFRGTVAHELGHTWGIPHPDAFIAGFGCGPEHGQTVMQCHWDFLVDTLLDYEKRHLLSLDYFEADTAAQYRLVAALRAGASVGLAERAFERDTIITWLEGRGGGSGYPWAVILTPGEGPGMVEYRLPGLAGFAADVGVVPGAAGRFLVRAIDDRGSVLSELQIEAPDPPRRFTVDLGGRPALVLFVWALDGAQGSVVFGNPRAYFR